MNEKIKEFAINSQLVSVCDLRGTLVSGWQEGVDLTEYLEDFAELIVKECVGILEPKSRYMGEGPEVLKDKIRQIKQHFGVEE